jgi:hypothetical protein
MCHAKKSLTIYGDGSLTINASYNDSISTDGIFNLTRGGGSAGNSGGGGGFPGSGGGSTGGIYSGGTLKKTFGISGKITSIIF